MNHIKSFFKEKGLYLFCRALVFAATAAGITLSLEPVFSALFAYVTLGERLGLGQFAGAALMLGGVLWISTRER